MKKYKVYECDEKVTPKGKHLKKLVLQGEGDKYPMKNVTLWGDHSMFDEIEAGKEFTLEIRVEDSKIPNPHNPGTFYKNRTVLENLNPNGTVAVSTGLEDRVKKLEDEVFGKPITQEESHKQADEAFEALDDIQADDVPF